MYEKSGSTWDCILETNGIVGMNGVTANSCEGDYCTPQGIFSLGFAFGTESMSGLGVEYRQVNPNCYWVDDVNSPLYNQWVESNSITWNSAEHLIDYLSVWYFCLQLFVFFLQ